VKDTQIKPAKRSADSFEVREKILTIAESRLKKAKDNLELAEKEQIIAFAIRSKTRIEQSEIFLEKARSELARAVRDLADAKKLKRNSSKDKKSQKSKQLSGRKSGHKKTQAAWAFAGGSGLLP